MGLPQVSANESQGKEEEGGASQPAIIHIKLAQLRERRRVMPFISESCNTAGRDDVQNVTQRFNGKDLSCCIDGSSISLSNDWNLAFFLLHRPKSPLPKQEHQ